MQISRVGIISHPKINSEKIEAVLRGLDSPEISLFLDPCTARKTGGEGTGVEDMDVEAAVILGGDGTVLWAAGKLKPKTLLLPINAAGGVGYLCEIAFRDMGEGINAFLRGEFFVEKRTKLLVDKRYEVLNEVIIYPSKPATLMEFDICLDDVEDIYFRSDGVVVSTPTGSTAYSFSLGNPVIHPDTKAYIISPICPLMQGQPPLIVPEETKTLIRLLRKGGDASLVLDGRCAETLPGGDEILVEKSVNTADFIRFTEHFSHHYININERRKRDGREKNQAP